MGLLTLLIWLPIAGGVAVLATNRGEKSDGEGFRADRWLALVVSILVFVISLPLYTGFDSGTAAMQFVERAPWIRAFNVEY
ncbi:MAG: NADH-quinone oxidoreductase subunit M, partial [Gammaproteobacteria bacterium]|nr:NADH-quinone oxidoreductase subunit M [Gammaproteobacteria bacterium]